MSPESEGKAPTPEEHLLRWLNHHLRSASSESPEVKNFGPDLKVSPAHKQSYLPKIKGRDCALGSPEPTGPAELPAGQNADPVGAAVQLMGVPAMFLPEDLASCNEFMNVLLCAEIFCANHGLLEDEEFDERQKRNCVRLINHRLSEDNELSGLLPMKPKSNALFPAAKDGVLFGKLLHAIAPSCIDLAQLHVSKNPAPPEIKQNLGTALLAAKSLGCSLEDVDLLQLAKARPRAILAFLSSIFKVLFLP